MSDIDRITGKTALIAPIIDTMPAYNLLPIVRGTAFGEAPEVKAFARFKIEEAIREMKEAAKYLEKHLKEIDAEDAAQ